MLCHCHTSAMQCAYMVHAIVCNLQIVFDVILTNRLVIWQFTFFCFVAFDWWESVWVSQHIVHILMHCPIKSLNHQNEIEMNINSSMLWRSWSIRKKNERQLNSISLVTGNNRFIVVGSIVIRTVSPRIYPSVSVQPPHSLHFLSMNLFPYYFGSRDIISDRGTAPTYFREPSVPIPTERQICVFLNHFLFKRKTSS